MNREELLNLFAERKRSNDAKITMFRCSGREITAALTFKRNFEESGFSCGNAILDNTDSEYRLEVPQEAREFRSGLLLNHDLACPGDRILFEALIDDEVVASQEAGFECGKEEIIFPLDGAKEVTFRARSLSEHPQVAFYWVDPEIIMPGGDVVAMAGIKAWPGCLLPDFDYDGIPFVTSKWQQRTAELDKNKFMNEFVSGDGKIKISVEIRLYPEFNAVEYRPVLENISAERSGIIENFRSLAWGKACEFMPHYGHGGEFRSVFIRRNYGTKSNFLDFVAQPVILNNNTVYPRDCSRKAEMVSDEGRSSAMWLPFWGVDMSPSEGLLVGLGWTGAWRADFELDEGLFHMSAGMLKTRFYMEPGEKFIQPSVLVMFRENQSIEDGQNQFRRLLIEKFAPRDDEGNVRQNEIPVAVFGGIKTATHLKYIELFEKFKFPYEIYNIDAGWYGYGENHDVFTGTWDMETGNWRVNPAHPNGLRPISDAAKKIVNTVSIWFEPERARRGTDIIMEHPEWFVDVGEGNLLLNLGDPDALQFLIDMTIDLFGTNKIDQLHQDFNFDTLPHWASLDSPDRTGVAEMKYIAGLYAYWDALHAHSPEILVDHCASGGRRIDIETLRRGYVFWRSDAQCWPDNDIVQNQIQNYYLNEWFPFHTGGVWVVPNEHDEYNFFSSVSNGISDCTFIYKHEVPDPKEFDYAYHASLVREALRIRPYFLGNYYQLSHEPENLENWCAYQFHCGEKGMVMMFRRPESPNEDEVFRLREIEPDATYELEIHGQTEKVRLAGRELRHYSVSLSPRSFQLVYYKKIND